jgi:hypothetical protein
MGFHIDVDGVSDSKAEAGIESAIRECVGEPPRDEEWNMSVSSREDQSCVVVRTPRQALRKIFFSHFWNLSAAIPAWLQ